MEKESRIKLDEKKTSKRKVECKSCNYVCGFCVLPCCLLHYLLAHTQTHTKDPQSNHNVNCSVCLYAEEKEKKITFNAFPMIIGAAAAARET